MTGLKQWAITVCVVSVICAVLEMLIPDKKYEKLLKPAIAAFAVYTIIFPLKTAFTDCAQHTSSYDNTEISSRLREKVDSQAETAVRLAVCAAISETVRNITGEEPQVFADAQINDDGYITLNGVSVTVSETYRPFESIIKSRSAQICGLEESKITVNYE